MRTTLPKDRRRAVREFAKKEDKFSWKAKEPASGTSERACIPAVAFDPPHQVCARRRKQNRQTNKRPFVGEAYQVRPLNQSPCIAHHQSALEFAMLHGPAPRRSAPRRRQTLHMVDEDPRR